MHQVCFDKCKVTLSTSNFISTRSLVWKVSATRKSLVCSAAISEVFCVLSKIGKCLVTALPSLQSLFACGSSG